MVKVRVTRDIWRSSFGTLRFFDISLDSDGSSIVSILFVRLGTFSPSANFRRFEAGSGRITSGKIVSDNSISKRVDSCVLPGPVY